MKNQRRKSTFIWTDCFYARLT